METLLYRDRRGTLSKKWNGFSERFSRRDLLGLWIADMDFAAPQCVRDALQEKIAFGTLGYDLVPEDQYDSFIRWEQMYHGHTVKREQIRYAPGAVAGLNWLIRLIARPGDAVLIQPPVYYPFADAIAEQGCRIVKNELVNTNGVYSIDFPDFERKLKEERVRIFLLCSPHNPVGRVWRREELDRMLALCRRYRVQVISDEIHQDFVFAGHRHIPAAAVEKSLPVTLTAPSKTFNLAGFKHAIVIIPDEQLRDAYDAFARKIRVTGGGSLGYLAAQTAFSGGREWLDAVRKAVWENYVLLKSVLADRLPRAVLSPLEGTYLAWLDLGAYAAPEALAGILEGRCGLAVDYGRWFGENAACHIRINLATSRENMERAALALGEGLRRSLV